MQLKLTEVKRLLQSTDITLDDIAWHLGFSNGNYFSKVFTLLVNAEQGSGDEAESEVPVLPASLSN